MNGLIRKLMEKVLIISLTGMSIKAISTMTNSMGKEKKCCMIIVYTKEIFIEVKDKAKESSHGLTEVIMRVNFAIIR